VEVLQHALVVVGERDVVLDIDVEVVVPPIVAHVVDGGAKHYGEHAQVVKVLVEADVAQHGVDALHDVGRVQVVVIGHLLLRGILGLHTLEEVPSLPGLNGELVV